MLLLVFTEQGPQDFESLCRQLPFERERIGTCLSALEAEGFVSLLPSVSEEPSRRYGIPT
jgi:DNA-binding IclR family transcriptional regulator